MAAAIPALLKAYALFGLLMGAGNILYGETMLGDASVFKPKSASSALADSQIRYLGAHSAATGAIVWWASNSVLERKVPLAIVGAGLVAGGFGRMLAGWKNGFGPNMRVAMGIEVVLPVVFYVFGKVVGEW